MSPPVRVALLGFTAFEREHIATALWTQRRDKPVYRLCIDALPSCSLAIVDAAHAAAVGQVADQQRLASSVMVGGAAHAGAGAQLPRPIHLPSLLLALDELLAFAPAMSAQVQQVQNLLSSLQARPSHRGTVLLVDASPAGQPGLARELAPLGLDVQRVAGGGDALARLQEGRFEFVFLATGGRNGTGGNGGNGGSSVDPGGGSVNPGGSDGHDGDGLDGFHTCRLLQRLPPAQPVAPPPTLVLLLDEDTGINRLRAERSGADAWLTPPWSGDALLKIVDERERWLRQSGKRTG